MASIVAILFLASLFEYGYSIEQLSWPKKFHLTGDRMNLISGITQPFEIWYSEYKNRSRIDVNGGTVKKYYYPRMPGKIPRLNVLFEVHPEADKEGNAVINCKNQLTRTTINKSIADYLPSLEDFVFSDEEEHQGQITEVWEKTETDSDEYKLREIEETMIMRRSDEQDDEGVPIRYTKKTYDLAGGGLIGHTIINYDTLETKVSLKDLKPDIKSCFKLMKTLDSMLEDLHPNVSSHVDIAYKRYREHYKKSYENNEHELRKEIFRENWKFIKEHNSKNLSYKLSINEFADWTPREHQYLGGTRIKDLSAVGTQPFPHSKEEIEKMAGDLPENYDMRFEGYISRIKNQGMCGSCWAFAATATVEGTLARSNGGRLLDLSPQSLVDCAWHYDTAGCEGTTSINSVLKYIYDHGIPTTKDYGLYLEEDGVCRIKNMTNLYKIKGYVGVTSMSANALKAALYMYGPVTVTIWTTDEIMFYRSGVYYDTECIPGRINHAVTVVGYGVRDGTPYWIVKNSWGENWGEDGYILMSATDNNCNVLLAPYYVIV